MKFAQTNDGIKIAYATRGEGPLTLLFLHGWSGSGAYFDETFKYLDLTGLRAVTFDLRGHGDSDQPKQGYSDESIGQDALAVADAVQAEQFVAVGFSMSGRFAQYLSVLAPTRVRGQVLVAGCPAAPIPISEEIREDWVARAGNAVRLAEVTAMFTTRPVEPGVLAQFGRQAAKAAAVALDETLKICMHASFADRLAAIQTPTLVVGGIHDAIFTPEVLAQGVVAPLRRARLALLDSNHEIPIEQPREFAALLQAFVAGLG